MNDNKIMIICSSISLIACTFVILVFIYNKTLPRKRYHSVILQMTICDLMGSIGGCLGVHNKADVSCYFQWFLTNYFQTVAIFWALSIVLELYVLAKYGHEISAEGYTMINMFCWGLPLFTTLLPLTTEDVGPLFGTWCYLVEGDKGSRKTLLFWTIASFYFWVWISTLIMIYCYFSIYFYLKKSDEYTSQMISQALYKLRGYPIIIFSCWVVPSYVDVASAIDENYYLSDLWTDISLIFPLLIGFFSSILFFYTNFSTLKALYNGSNLDDSMLNLNSSISDQRDYITKSSENSVRSTKISIETTKNSLITHIY